MDNAIHTVVESDKSSIPVKKLNVPQSKGGNDECYTPSYGVKVVIPFIEEGKTYWCPFDTQESEFVKQIKEAGANVIHSHIWEGKDFYEYEPTEHYDAIVSNPHFTNKYKTIARLLELDKPFAILLPHTILGDGTLYTMFDNYDKELQLLLLDRRMEFYQADKSKKSGNVSFKAIYYCYKFLPKQMILAELPKPRVRRAKNRTDLTYNHISNNTNYLQKGVA